MEVKVAWLGISASHGMKAGGKIAGRKWNIGYEVMGGTGATTLVEYRGAVWLAIAPTKPHIIGAKRLGARGASWRKDKMTGERVRVVRVGAGIAGKAGMLASNRAGKISNRGAFGSGAFAKRGASKGAQALTIGGNLRAYAFHPGTKGKTSVWPESKAAAQRIAPAGYGHAVRGELAKSFGKQAGGALKGLL